MMQNQMNNQMYNNMLYLMNYNGMMQLNNLMYNDMLQKQNIFMNQGMIQNPMFYNNMQNLIYNNPTQNPMNNGMIQNTNQNQINQTNQNNSFNGIQTPLNNRKFDNYIKNIPLENAIELILDGNKPIKYYLYL